MLDTVIAALRRPSIKPTLIAVLRRAGLLGPAFRVYERLRARAAADPAGQVPYDEGLPLPPADLRVLVAGTADVPWFLEFGREMFGLIADCSARHAVPIDRLHAVLEFGCGSGRVLRHWHVVHGPAVHGTDYNRRLAAWCRTALPFATIGDNDAAPPLPYADATFDLIYAISVFTHLKAAMQRPWLDELHRVLAPGGLAIVTTHGPNFVHQLDAAERAAFDRGELVVHYEETSGLNVCNAYHPEAYVTHDLAQAFDVLERIPAGTRPLVGQDVYVLRARAIRAA